MADKTKNKVRPSKKRIILLIVAVPLIVVGSFVAVEKARYYKDAADQANLVSIRELIITAIRAVKQNAPVDPRTGDVYFPEAKLYLPDPGGPTTFTYLFDSVDIADSQSGLSVSTYPVRGSTPLYTAKNMNELFAAVPKLQACSRGIKLVYNKFPQSDKENMFVNTAHLNNGKDVYIYIENKCPELKDTANLFTDIKAY